MRPKTIKRRRQYLRYVTKLRALQDRPEVQIGGSRRTFFVKLARAVWAYEAKPIRPGKYARSVGI